MERRKILLVIGAMAALTLIAAACGDTVKTGTPGGPKPGPEPELIDEGEWTIEVPDDWTRKDITNDADGKKAIRYQSADGRYFIVAIDPLGSGYVYDTLWSYEVKGAGFEVTRGDQCTSAEDDACADDDDRFDGYILWETGTEPEKVGGHTWYFLFGIEDATTMNSTDAVLFEQLTESVRVTV